MQNYVTLAVVLLIFFVVITCSEGPKQNQNNRSTGHPCFCELSGQVDDCNCKVESVSTFNNLQIHPRLNSLLERDYFKFYKVNLNRPCPFWADDGGCAFESCAVCPCAEEDVPCGLKEASEQQPSSKYSAKENEADEEEAETESCESRSNEEIRLSALDTTISKKDQQAFETWQEHDDSVIDFCEYEDEDSLNMQYVDLTINPERYTGYKGKSPQRIWNSIYRENCFKPDPNVIDYESLASKKFIKGLCLEKRVFYRLISGLHSSINIHLSAKYLLNGGLGRERWGHNVEEFKRRFDPKTSKGEGPIRLKNLFFTYLVVLRAIDKATTILEKEKYYSGIESEDDDMSVAIGNFLTTVRRFPNHFNESAMFQGDPQQAQQLKGEFRNHFKNITRIMDCVGCDKCKLWGKLQIQGLGTALKILFTREGKHGRNLLRLKRGEIVSLFNAFGRLSSSVKELAEFQNLISSADSNNKHPNTDSNGFF